MATGPRYKVQFRRRREGKTDYRHRKSLLVSGLPRAVVRCTGRNTIVQFTIYSPTGDMIIASANTKELSKMGWKKSTSNTPAAYLAGYMAAHRASKKGGVEKAVLDIGLQTPSKGAKVFAALKGILDAGVEVPHNEEILPSEDRIKGAHIGDEAKKMFDSTLAKIKEGK
jgi:large subunit ribosomal protein L18